MKKLKIGIAGYGKMGQIREKTIQESGEAEVTAIEDCVACPQTYEGFYECMLAIACVDI